MNFSKFLRIARVLAPIALAFTPLAPIAAPVAAAIAEAEALTNASGAEKLAHASALAVDAARLTNQQAGRVILDPTLVETLAPITIGAVVDAINLVKDVHEPEIV